MNCGYKGDWLKRVLSYARSSENLKDCEPFEQLNQKYILLQKQYADSFSELRDSIEPQAVRREYSKGGLTLHRGFYSPSALDLVSSGCNRGRLLKRTPKTSSFDYEYLFDGNGNLICAKTYGRTKNSDFGVIAVEFLIYDSEKVLSIKYEYFSDFKLSFISECRYENKRLVRYANALCNMFYDGDGCVEINVETSDYDDGMLKSVCWYCYMPATHILQQKKYTFFRDQDGFLSTYTAEQLGGFCSGEATPPRSFRVMVRRK